MVPVATDRGSPFVMADRCYRLRGGGPRSLFARPEDGPAKYFSPISPVRLAAGAPPWFVVNESRLNSSAFLTADRAECTSSTDGHSPVKLTAPAIRGGTVG